LTTLEETHCQPPVQHTLPTLIEKADSEYAKENYEVAYNLYKEIKFVDESGWSMYRCGWICKNFLPHRAHNAGFYFSSALPLLKSGVERGLAKSQTGLGVMNDWGYGVTSDVDEAVRLYTLAANQNFPLAQYNLGVMRYNGRGLPLDVHGACEMWKLASAGGYKDAMYNLATIYMDGDVGGIPADPEQAEKWWRLAVEHGDLASMHELAEMLYYGQDPVTRRPEEALDLWERAAQKGNTSALEELGRLYAKGDELVPQDCLRAVKYFKQLWEKPRQEVTYSYYLFSSLLLPGLEEEICVS
jgi:TPR repeat protein